MLDWHQYFEYSDNEKEVRYVLELKGIMKSYKTKDIKTVVLKDINLKVMEGEFLCLMGASGCGKSTLLNIIGDMDSFDAGEYIFNGKNVKKMRAKEAAVFKNKNIGFVFQAFNLVDDLNAESNVEMPMGYAGIGRRERKKRARDLLKKVGLEGKEKNYPSQLSGGQQQRVAIARAIANNPMLLIADEPTGNLDYESGKEIMCLLKKLNEEGMTIIMVTHDEKVAGYANRTVRMFDGKLI